MQYIEIAVAFMQLTGKLHLTDAQADARKAMLKPLGENRFATTAPVGFKRGEVLGVENAPKDGVTLLDLNELRFDRQIARERDAAAKAKAEILRERQERDAAIRRAAAQRAKEAEAKKAAAAKAREAKLREQAEAAARAKAEQEAKDKADAEAKASAEAEAEAKAKAEAEAAAAAAGKQ